MTIERNKCLISFANNRGNYMHMMARLNSSLTGHFDGDFMGFIGEETLGCPPHMENPYAFKVYCWQEAIEAGYTNILWLDTSCVVVRDLSPVFECIQSEGYIMQEAGHIVGNWCNDRTLEYFGLTRDEAMLMPMYGNAGFLGLNMESELAHEFFNRWKKSMEDGMFKGSWEDHRHDMVCGSIIANQLGMKFKSGNEWLEYAPVGSEPKNETIVIQASGM